MATPHSQVVEWHDFLKAHPLLGQQFGQGDDESTYNGATGCTHADLQVLIKAKTGTTYSHDEISKIAGYPWPGSNPGRRGMRWSSDPDSEVMKVVRHFNLPYYPHFVDSYLTADVWQGVKNAVSRGPAMIAVRYLHQPQHRNFVYQGKKADGHPNGFALVNGKTQLSGFTGAHADLWVDYYRNTNGIWVHHVKDPNHNSPSRPENPAFDTIRDSQMKALINSIRQLIIFGGRPRSLGFLLPSHTFVPR
jgi:hypothetical protein